MADKVSRRFIAFGRTSQEKVSALYYGGNARALRTFLEGAKGTAAPKIGEFVVKFESGSVKVMKSEDFEDEYAVM